MRYTKFALTMLTAAVLASCGGNNNSSASQAPKVKYSAEVIFGDSLADVGTYGSKFTINGVSATNPDLTGKIWAEVLAKQLGLPAPCPAETGAPSGTTVAVQMHAGCFGYAQGGARTMDAALGGGNLPLSVVQQVQLHLANIGGKFKGDELVTVTVGGNDVSAQLALLNQGATTAGQAAGATAFMNTYSSELVGGLAAGATVPQSAAVAIGTAFQSAAQSAAAQPGATQQSIVGAATQAAVGAAATQPGNAAVADPTVYGPIATKAQTDATAAATTAGAQAGAQYFAANAQNAVVAMGTAGATLAGLVKTQLVANGANYVVVNNLPDFADAPVGKALPASVQPLVVQMVNAFNSQLSAGLAGQSKVLVVDLYSVSRDEIMNPAPYGLSNTTAHACTTDSSLTCTLATLQAGDVSHYMFADDRHPTPYEHRLVAQYIAEQMVIKGWL